WLRASDVPELIPLLVPPEPAPPLVDGLPPALPPKKKMRGPNEDTQPGEQAPAPEPVVHPAMDALFADLSLPDDEAPPDDGEAVPWGDAPVGRAAPASAQEERASAVGQGARRTRTAVQMPGPAATKGGAAAEDDPFSSLGPALAEEEDPDAG